VVLNFFPQAFGSFAGLPIRADWIHSGHIDGVYDLKLQAHDYNGSGCLTLQLDLSTSTFSAYDRERLPAHLKQTLAVMLENPDTKIDGFDLLTGPERVRTIVDYNRPASHPIPDDCVLPRIARIVRHYPNDPALRQGAKTLSYAELWEQVERAAATLRRNGVTPGTCVAIVMPRSAEAVLAILATMRAGAAYIPIDTNYPAERIARIFENARPHCSIHLDGTAPGATEPTTPRLAWSSLLEEHNDSVPPLPYPQLEDLAYVIYTSGSTGTPKGVEIEHRGLIDYLDWAERSYIRGERLRYPLFTSLSFDLTLTSLVLPLMTGGELIVYPPAAAEVDSALIDVVNDNAVDFIKLTPSHFSLLRQVDLGASRITRLVLGGEDLKHALAASVTAQFRHDVELYNEYGPTEAVVGCMIHKLDPRRSAPPGASVPIGQPADHVAIYLLNSAGLPVPEGVPGELCIARYGLARGYRQDSAKTAAAFVSNPFAPAERMYRTGDLARFSNDGELSFLGRIDSQVKVSGHRIELGEIEAALLEQVEIENAFVHAHRSGRSESTSKALAYCRRCGLASNYPNVVFDDRGVCNTCNAFEAIKDEAQAYFQASEQLMALFESSRRKHQAKYDCMMLYSGGKDSTYALGKLVDLGLRVYTFTLDNGYISEQAKTNIRRVVSALGVDHEFASTPAMNEIFRDSLTRFSNVCNGCFKTIYTLGLSRARELRIPIIVTGLSRGQFFETRLTEHLFQRGRFSPADVDQAVLEARKAYHRVDDAVSRLLDTSHLKDDRIFEEITFVDFYRYWDASLEEIYSYLARRLPWIRPADTGRSTNCLVNDVGIYIHKKERGYHNYALPYSWDVRMGHKQRDEALEELDDRYDVTEVRRMLKEIGYNEDRLSTGQDRVRLTAYYVAKQPLNAAELERRLSKSLPAQMRPAHYVRLDALPLTPNGKVDVQALPKPDAGLEKRLDPLEPPAGPVEEHVFEVWAQCFKTRAISRTDSFFQLGGTSLDAMEVTLQLCRDFEIDLPLQTIFTKPRLADLCQAIESKVMEEIESLSEDEAEKALKT
jgi:amino acid adenylation domain-containing protein